ncbi:hypothetical protein C922_05528 [Plasmodium inui San Antonio 1]|uniref:Uncharacterized protein n=1 Tax=Plasmodium inui San Antonio 1 TaxID=1237626 RepID=W6ZXR9_9APIC|nr:hypothetical protein C922_05528 [Plasmodium inui San Antonio 1]EUD64093.1 hypothetical protein C922_05528 [Plasmodium inui San Antonio 1]
MKSIKIDIMGEYSGESIYTRDNALNRNSQDTGQTERNTPTDIRLEQSVRNLESNDLGGGGARIIMIIYYEQLRIKQELPRAYRIQKSNKIITRIELNKSETNRSLKILLKDNSPIYPVKQKRKINNKVQPLTLSLIGENISNHRGHVSILRIPSAPEVPFNKYSISI